MPTKGQKVRRASRTNVITINEMLKEAIDHTKTQTSPDGRKLVEYKPGQSDQHIADATNTSVPIVQGVRSELYGFLARSVKADMAAIDTQLQELRIKYERLIIHLCTNRIADIKHLRLQNMPLSSPTPVPVTKAS